MRGALHAALRCLAVLAAFILALAALAAGTSALLVETYGSLFVVRRKGDDAPAFRSLRGLDLFRDAACLA